MVARLGLSHLLHPQWAKCHSLAPTKPQTPRLPFSLSTSSVYAVMPWLANAEAFSTLSTMSPVLFLAPLAAGCGIDGAVNRASTTNEDAQGPTQCFSHNSL